MTQKQILRTKADLLWKMACFKKWGRKCEICGGIFKVTPHHFYYRNNSPYLRFSILNGIILDAKCHFLLHFHDPKLIEEKIIKIRGKKWLNKLNKLRNSEPKYFKITTQWLEEKNKELKKLL